MENLKCYGNLYEVEHAKHLKKKTTEMHEEIRMAKLLKQKLLEVTRNAKIETFEKNERCSQKLRAENLSNEINFRCQSLNTRYDQELRYLSDYQILDMTKS